MKQRSVSNQGWVKWISGAAFGTAAMYVLDPDRGRRRRTWARDKIRSLVIHASDAIELTMRDIGNRSEGMQARLNRWLLPRAPRTASSDDLVVVARVRAKIGRVVSHPHAIVATVHEGRLVLSGPILADEKPTLMETVQAIAGVASVEDKLQVHEHPEGVAGLQGSSRRTPRRSEIMQENWTPALRGMAVAGGSALGLYGLVRRTPVGVLLALTGIALVTRGLSNKPLKQLAGLDSHAHPIDLQKIIEINAPLETVFDAWSKYENFPHFMSHVLEVRDLGQQRSHWVVKGPAGVNIEWEASVTEYLRPIMLAWHTQPGAEVEHAGSVRFEPTDNGTRATVRLSYHPPAGALGHRLAVLLGADPKLAMDEDLMRMKNFIESGIPPHDAAKPTMTTSMPGALLH